MLTSGSYSRPSAPTVVETTHLFMPTASRIFWRAPEPNRKGTTKTVASAMYGRMSGTPPVTCTAGRVLRAVTWGGRIATDDEKLGVRASPPNERKDLAGKVDRGIDVGRMTHEACEDDSSRNLLGGGLRVKVCPVDRERDRDDLARFVVQPEPVGVVLGHRYDKIVLLAVVTLEGAIAPSLAPGEETRPE